MPLSLPNQEVSIVESASPESSYTVLTPPISSDTRPAKLHQNGNLCDNLGSKLIIIAQGTSDDAATIYDDERYAEVENEAKQ